MKFLDSNTSVQEGKSTVEIKHRGKIYSGTAKLHPDDAWSEFTGCRYAEMRAEMNALKAEWKEKKAACEECRKFVTAVGQYNRFDKTSDSAKAVFTQLNKRIKEVNKLAEEIGKIEMQLNIAIAQQTKLNNKIDSKND